MKRETKGGLLQVGIAVLAATAIIGVASVTSDAPDPGPVPTCNGEQATAVLVKYVQLPGDSVAIREQEKAASLAPYQSWIDAGVDVQTNTDELLRGTYGHDVLVSLVSTTSGGFVGAPHPASLRSTTANVTAGDYACSFLEHSQDIYYMPKGGFSDYVFDAGGADDYWMGGCTKEGPGSVGDRECDVLVDQGNSDNVGSGGIFGSNRDDIFGFDVPKGRVQRLNGGIGWNHFYVGKGAGRVIVDGAGCEVNIGGEVVPCNHPGNQGGGFVVPNGGDHVHECPRENSVIDFGLEIKQYHHITALDIEYFGPENSPPLNPSDLADPCGYQFSTLGV